MTAVIANCTTSDLPELFDRFAEWYRYNPRLTERDYFDWQYRNTPWRRSPDGYDLLLLREGGRIVGSLGYVAFELRQGDVVSEAAWPLTWYCESGRGGGLRLFGRYFEMFDNRLITRFSDVTGEILAAFRIPYLQSMPRWWAAVDGRRVGSVCGLDEPGDREVLAGSQAALGRIGRGAWFDFVDRLDDDEEFGWSHLPGVVNGCRRSGRYLNWRYFAIPRHNYRMMRSDRAFAVYRVEPIMHHDGSVVRIVEWTFGDRDGEAALATLLADTAAQDPILIDFHATARCIGRSLEPLGFVPQAATRKPMPDLFRPLNHSGGYQAAVDLPPHRTKRTVDFDTWYITLGDSDVERVKL